MKTMRNGSARSAFYAFWLTALLALGLTLGGCGSPPDIVSQKPAEGTTYSDAEIRQITVDQPFLLSGDYFRERGEHAPAQKGREPGSDAPIAVSDSRNPAVTTAAGPDKTLLKLKLGLLTDTRNVSAEDAALLTAAAAGLAQDLPIVPVAPDEIAEVLAENNVSAADDLARLAGVIGLYPGVRMLVWVDSFELPQKLPGQARAAFDVIDTATVYRHPRFKLEAVLDNEQQARSFAGRVLSTAVEKALEKSRIMPWFCRSFGRENTTWYITAGRESGLRSGDTLQVLSGGKLVKAPSGMPAGWIPGQSIGELRVEQMFGADFAACSLVRGTGPEPQDRLVR